MAAEGESGGRVSQSDLARALGVQASTVSRYLTRYPHLKGEDGLVGLSEVIAHRRDNLHAGGVRDARERDREAVADLRELELAERRGTLKPAAEIEAIVLAAMGELWDDIGAQLEGALRRAGVTEIEAAEAAVEEVLHTARRRFADRMAELGRRHDGGGGE